jgi:hypothetical protein
MKALSVFLTVSMYLVFANPAFAQNSNSSVSGFVQDTTKANIPGVTITATNTDTGVATTVLTNEAGTYNFLSLLPGTYKLSAELLGFRPSSIKDVHLGSNESFRYNFTMQVGTADQAVDVTAQADTAIAESSASIGQVLTGAKVRDLPIIGNDVLDLISTMGGVRGGPDSTLTTFAGIGAGMVNTVRDGLSVNDGRYLNGIFSATVINPDMVAEMRVILTPVDAEMGRGNGQVQISTRSGTNRFTGSGVWTIHNSALDANTWTNNSAIVNGAGVATVPNWANKNEFTVSMGGPILKNKTFFFVLGEWRDENQRSTQRPTVLTPCAKNGIFRYFDGWQNGNTLTTRNTTGANPTTPVVDSNGNPLVGLLNPAGTAVSQLHYFSVFGPLANTPTKSDCSDAVLSGSFWDANRSGPDPTGLISKYLNAMPAADRYDGGDGLNTAIHQWTRGTNSSGSLAIGAGTDAETDRKQINTKIDHNFNPKNKLAFNFSYQWADGGNSLSTWPTGFDGTTQLRPYELTANFTSTLSASLLNEARFGIRMGHLVISPAWEQTADKEAHDAAQSLLVQANGFPVAFVPASVGGFSPSNYICLSPAYNGCAEQGNTSPLYDYADTLSYAKGRHAFKFGVDIRHGYSKGWASPTAPIPSAMGGGGNNPSLAFQNATNFPNLVVNNQTLANSLLYFLNGSVGEARQIYYLKDSSTPLTWQDYNSNPRKILNVVQNEFAGFIKDDWKVRPNLTLNLGLRYEYYGVPYEGAGLGTAPIDGSAALFGVSGRSFTNWLRPDNGVDLSLATTAEFVGPKTANPNKSLYKDDWNNIGPAVGFAWALPWFGEGKTNVRGGYQITYSGGGQAQPIDNFILSNPGFQSNPMVTAPADGVSYFNLSNLPSVIPVAPTVQPMQPIQVQKQNQPLAVYNSNIATPYVQNFTLSVTRNVSRDFSLDVRYVGTRGLKLWGNFDINTSDIYYNQPLLDAFKAARSGADLKPVSEQTPAEQAGLLLLDQMFLGLNVPGSTAIVGCNPAAPAAACGPVNGTTMRGAAEMRLSTTFRTALANGDFNTLSKSLDIFNGTGNSIVTGAGAERGTVLKRANSGFNVPGGTTIAGGLVVPAGLFPANWITANPQFSTANLYSDSGSSNYHSVQIQGTLRPIHGMGYQATYLYSKSLGISASTYTNPADRNADYTLTGSDQRHNFRSNGTFELPIGPNKLVLGNSTGVLARIVERWQSSLIYNFSSGTPVSILAGNMLYGLGVPDIVPLPDGSIPEIPRGGKAEFPTPSPTSTATNIGSYFDPGKYVKITDPQCARVAAALTTFCTLTSVALANPNDPTQAQLGPTGSPVVILQNPQPGMRGTLGQKTIEGVGNWSLDANISKTFRISESKSLQVRMDATNITNHPGMNAPSLNITTTTVFGQITNKPNNVRQFQGQLRFSF